MSSITTITTEERTALIESCLKAKSYAYSPYSKFRVGCAIFTECGKTFTGCNVENVSYGLTICAERTAYTKAVSEGFKNFKAVAVCTDVKERYIAPCGACRQFMSEFGDVQIIMTNDDKGFSTTTLGELLPKSFDSEALEDGQRNHIDVKKTS